LYLLICTSAKTSLILQIVEAFDPRLPQGIAATSTSKVPITFGVFATFESAVS